MTQPPDAGPSGAQSVPAAAPTCYRHTDRETWIRCQRCERPICPDCMRDAAVGFQCVECVKKGTKETRSARTAYGGLRPTDASATSIGLIAVNVAVWVALLVAGGFGSRLFNVLALLPNSRCDLDTGYVVVPELPKTATGKIQKFVLRKGRANITAQ